MGAFVAILYLFVLLRARKMPGQSRAGKRTGGSEKGHLAGGGCGGVIFAADVRG